jgi:hypothetical protein
MESIIYEIKGGYELFGEFQIKKKDNQYIVTKTRTDLEETFYNLKNAIVWVTMYKRNKLTEADRVKNLDILLEGAEVSQELHKKLYDKTKDLDTKTIYFVKLQEAVMKKTSILEELDKYILNTKTWQNKQFKSVTK